MSFRSLSSILLGKWFRKQQPSAWQDTPGSFEGKSTSEIQLPFVDSCRRWILAGLVISEDKKYLILKTYLNVFTSYWTLRKKILILNIEMTIETTLFGPIFKFRAKSGLFLNPSAKHFSSPSIASTFLD